MIEFFAALDLRILQELYALRDPAVVQIFIWITELGNTVVVGGVALSAGLFLLVRRKLPYFAGLCISVLGTIVIVFPLKEIIARARPDVVYQAYLENMLSFPSGHAAFSIALYGFLAYMLHRSHISRSWRIVGIIFMAILITLIGLSRMYLGLHYASDIIAGYAIGGVMLLLGIVGAKKLESFRI